MKRTQSKAVKPATKGAVKVPKEWRELRKGSVIRWTDMPLEPEGFRAYTDAEDNCVGEHYDFMGRHTLHIRRNPRAARATTKGAE